MTVLGPDAVPFSRIATVAGSASPNGQYSTDLLQVIGLGANDGLAYVAAYQDNGGTWHSGGVLPGRTFPLSAIWTARGNYAQAQVIGKAASDGRLYIVAWQDQYGDWRSGELLPGQNPGFTVLDWSWGDKHVNDPYGNCDLWGSAQTLTCI